MHSYPSGSAHGSPFVLTGYDPRSSLWRKESLNFTSGVVQVPIDSIEWTSEFVRRKWLKECLQLALKATRQIKNYRRRRSLLLQLPAMMSFHRHLFTLQSPLLTEGAQHAFTTVRVLHQSLLHTMSPGYHIYDMLQLMGPYLYDCSQWYDEEQARNTALQQQLDAVNSKLLDQSSVHHAEIFA